METTCREEYISNEYNYTPGDIASALMSLLVGWIISEFMVLGEKTVYLSAAVCALFFTGTALMYYRGKFSLKNRYITVQLVLIVLFTMNLLIGSNIFIRDLNIITIICMSDYFVYSLSAGKVKSGIFVLGELFQSVIMIPLKNFGECIILLGNTLSRQKTGKAKSVIKGLLLSVPVMLIVFPLMVSADENISRIFEDLIYNLQYDLGEQIYTLVLKLVVTFLTGSRMFGVLFANRKKEFVTEDEMREKTVRARKHQPAVLVTMIVPMCLLYVMFFVSQLSYFVSAFSGTLPSGFSYAEYARKGFFELCAVAAVNLAVISFINRKCIRNEESVSPAALKISTSVLSVFTEILIITAISKMIMYIGYYGFTPLRIYVTSFMAVMFVMFILIIVKQFSDKTETGKWIAGLGLAGMMMITFSGIDARVAQWNIALYKSGVTEELDINLLRTLSDEAVPYIEKLAAGGGEYSDEAFDILHSRAMESRKHEFNITACAADRILKKY